MSSLAKRVLVVVVAGLGAVGVATLLGRKDDTARFATEKARIDAECRAFRRDPRHHHAAVCRSWDAYEPKALPRYAEVGHVLDDARARAARGDRLGAEASLRSALASIDDLERMGALIPQLVAASIVKQSLDILSAHPELDAKAILRDVRLDVTRPFEKVRLQHAWILVHWNDESAYPGPHRSRSTSELVEAIERSDTALRAMDERIVHADVAACEAASRAADLDPDIAPDLCAKMVRVVRTAARLDAARR